jgi:predicted PhzF superfamily epimerase YddE/YHI9
MTNEGDVRDLKPDYAMLRRIPVRGVIVTSRASTTPFDFVSRFFAPGSGIDEDPVTGSAHCALAPYWAPRLRKEDFVATRRLCEAASCASRSPAIASPARSCDYRISRRADDMTHQWQAGAAK